MTRADRSCSGIGALALTGIEAVQRGRGFQGATGSGSCLRLAFTQPPDLLRAAVRKLAALDGTALPDAVRPARSR